MNFNGVTLNVFRCIIGLYLCLFGPVSVADSDQQALDIITNAIQAAGGQKAWLQSDTLVVHERQLRNEEGGVRQVELVHYMDTAGKAYRLEMNSSEGVYVFGWDGHHFWALKDKRPGGHELEREARRVIADAYYRFNLPFILDDPSQIYSYEGTDRLDGMTTHVIKASYSKGPAERYFETHADAAGHNSAGQATEHGSAHHHGGEVYFFHFDDSNRLVKVYFSHHGDGTYETLLLNNFIMVDGISREQSRKLLRPDGETLYDSSFTSVVFRDDIDESFFSKP